MGRRGPKPQPAGIREQKQPVRSKREKRAVLSDVSHPNGAIEPPKWLKGDGLKVWDRLAPTLRQAKLLTEADAHTFGRYCHNFARWLDLQKLLKERGDIYEIETASGRVRRPDPAFLMADRLERMLLAQEDRFGLNPAERQRIMAARANTGVAGDLFSQASKDTERRADDPAAQATPAAEPSESPVGFLN